MNNMTKSMFQWEYEIDGLIPRELRIRKNIWLKKDALLEKKGEFLNVYLLGNEKDIFKNDKKILPYLKISSLVTSNAPTLKGGGGHSIQSMREFGKKSPTSLKSYISSPWPKEAIKRAEKYAPEFLKHIRRVQNKYGHTIEENRFLQIALDFFYNSQIKSIYSNEGFISIMISLEALFNESSDNIKYKLAHRAGFLLGLAKFSPREVFEHLKKFYHNRSKLIHGQVELAYNPNRGKIQSYTRYAIMIFCILLKNPKRRKIRSKDRKMQLLREIDYGMLDISKREQLRKEIDKHLNKFKLNIPRTFSSNKNGYRKTAW